MLFKELARTRSLILVHLPNLFLDFGCFFFENMEVAIKREMRGSLYVPSVEASTTLQGSVFIQHLFLHRAA